MEELIGWEKGGPAICPLCGHTMIWGSDFMNDEAGRAPEGDGSIARNFSCPHCGSDVDVYEPEDEEKKNYPYWA